MDPVAQFFRSTTGLSILLCLLGGLGVFLPWDVPIVFWPKIGAVLWHGGAISSLFLVLLLYVVGTSPLQPIPAWRPIFTFAGASVILVLINVYAYGPGGNWAMFVGCWVTFLSTIALLIVSSVELRNVLAQRNTT